MQFLRDHAKVAACVGCIVCNGTEGLAGRDEFVALRLNEITTVAQ